MFNAIQYFSFRFCFVILEESSVDDIWCKKILSAQVMSLGNDAHKMEAFETQLE